MAIVKLGEQRLWVEGGDAYSIDEIKQRHADLLDRKQLLADRIAEEDAEIKAHQEQLADLNKEAEEVENEFQGVDKILARILEAEKEPEVEELPIVEDEEAPADEAKEELPEIIGEAEEVKEELAEEAKEEPAKEEIKEEVQPEVKEDKKKEAKKVLFKNRVKVIC